MSKSNTEKKGLSDKFFPLYKSSSVVFRDRR